LEEAVDLSYDRLLMMMKEKESVPFCIFYFNTIDGSEEDVILLTILMKKCC
jgi:hypothetical protein